MTDDKTDEAWTYLGQLMWALYEFGVRGPRIGDHVAEVAAHLEESGQDPVAEFGRPAELAARLAADERLVPRWARSFLVRWATMVLGCAGAVVLVMAISAGDRVSVEVGSLVDVVILGTLSLAVPGFLIRRLDGQSWTTSIRWPLLIGIPVGCMVAVAGVLILDQVVIGELPQPVAIIGGVALILMSLGVTTVIERPVRFPPHAAHLRRLRRGAFAGRAPGTA